MAKSVVRFEDIDELEGAQFVNVDLSGTTAGVVPPTVFDEEWHHDWFANRDLDGLASAE